MKIGDLKQAYSLMLRSLSDCTGLSEFERKIVSCYTIGTYSLSDPATKTYPLLAIRGKTASGKSTILDVVQNYGRNAKKINMGANTVPMVRDHLAACREAVAILEEADSCLHDRDAGVEVILNARYSRATETGGIKVQISESNNSHASKDIRLFGSTVLHQRKKFTDPMLDGKTICINCRPNQNREYVQFMPTDLLAIEGRELLAGGQISLPKVVKPARIADRVFNTYLPVVAMASLMDDALFNDYLFKLLHAETKRLQQVQGEEPETVVLNALIERIFDGVFVGADRGLVGDPTWSRIPIPDLCNLLRQRQDPSERRFSAFQVAGYCRDAGFRVESHSGRQHVFPTVDTLFWACDQSGIDDEVVKALRLKVSGHACMEEKEETPRTHAGDDFSRGKTVLKDLSRQVI